ncbi:MAG: septal ring lytic transglycosylase RlpA family protein [Beijerinckiaceae bacterium]|nr:septal ring lytic transglycosylase RlpA family protein [Beijerinckiaceae bacterium]
MLKATILMTAMFSYVSLFSTDSTARTYEGTFVNVSFYSSGSRTASGEPFNKHGFTAASRTLPFGTRLHLTNPATGRSVIVRVNDRGPFVRGRDLDLSRGAAAAIGMITQGTATLKVVRLSNSPLVNL